jgi:hypothetical protein
MIEEVFGLKERIEKVRLLMVRKEWGDEQVSWKEGWPQPGDVENGKGGVDENGGQECNLVVLLMEEHVCVDVGKSRKRMRKERVMVKGKGDIVGYW